jgi:signal transduction histidine kinase
VADFRAVADQSNLRLEVECVENLPPVLCSRKHQRRVLDNLIGNAIKFTPSGGQITLRVYPSGGGAVLEVSDTGIGIPPQEQARIFERFYQVDGSAKRRYGGVGLGLALVKEIIEACGGRVWVESTPGEGTTFGIWLPVEDPARLPHREEA